ncbi:single-stranded DNA-binding protein [Catenulispora pinisilvae]|uniref:single-stranded DNA-binding protein n=1 Tax=Catenulispora pinisilvae TaxID=2705253 RepID=UPI001891A69F|nr:single-stranded DNA-binding protein [Catenulispora pinisilvae]
MSYGDTVLTMAGNLTADPEYRVLDNGQPVARFSIATSRRIFDKTTSQWEDGDKLVLRCTAWRNLADNIAESLTKGARVVAVGRLKQHMWEDENGIQRLMTELELEDVGTSLKYATATIAKASRRTGSSGGSWSKGASPEPPF